MAISFPRAPRVQPGEVVSSHHLAGLAHALNARILSGLGDPTWRIHFYLAGLFRQMRAPNASGMLWPAQHEFFTAYQMVPPEVGEWPLMGPGDPEGANLASPIPAFIWGNEGIQYAGEEGRLGVLPWSLDGRPPASLWGHWVLGKAQRGGFDSVTRAVASPALAAARSWSNLRYSLFSPHANAYGGFLALPELGTACADPDPDDGLPPRTNYLYKFTSGVDGVATSGLHGTISTDGDGRAVVTYAGSCDAYDSDADGEWDTYLDHVAFIVRGEYEYTVFLWDGSIDVLPTSQWVEGPYSGSPRLSKTAGGQLARALASYCREFRGAVQQARAAAALAGAAEAVTRWNRYAFDFQRFLTSQYLLAPARGTLAGQQILVEYPACQWLAPTTPPYWIGEGTRGTLAVGDQSGTVYRVHEGSVVAGLGIRAEALDASARIGIEVDGEQVSDAVLLPEEGYAEAIVWLKTPATGGQTVSLRLGTTAAFSIASGRIWCELAELYDYKPDLNDLYLTLRVQGAL